MNLSSKVEFVSQICHENINKPLDGAFLADFGINIGGQAGAKNSAALWLSMTFARGGFRIPN